MSKEKKFEENLVELENIVKKLENGETSLDDAIDEFKKAMELAKKCDTSLKNAEEQITKLVKDNKEIIDFNVEE